MTTKILRFIATLLYVGFTSLCAISILLNKTAPSAVIACVILLGAVAYSFFTNKYKLYFILTFIVPLALDILTLFFLDKVVSSSGMFGELAAIGTLVIIIAIGILSVIGLIVHLVYRYAIHHISETTDNPTVAKTKINKITAILSTCVIMLPFIIMAWARYSDYISGIEYERKIKEIEEDNKYKEKFYERRGYYNTESLSDHQNIEHEYLYEIFTKYLTENESKLGTRDIEIVYEWRENHEDDDFYVHIPVDKIEQNGTEYIYGIAVKGWYQWGEAFYNSQGYIEYRSDKDLESSYDLNDATVSIREYPIRKDIKNRP